MHPLRDDAVERRHHRGPRRKLLSGIAAGLRLRQRGLGVRHFSAGILHFLPRSDAAREQVLQPRQIFPGQAQARLRSRCFGASCLDLCAKSGNVESHQHVAAADRVAFGFCDLQNSRGLRGHDDHVRARPGIHVAGGVNHRADASGHGRLRS